MSAPAGTGKTTLIRRLTREMLQVIESVSYTSREKRPQEKEGVDYHFISREEFEKKIQAKDFLEYVELYGDYYGTSKSWVEERLSQGKHVFLVIDTQGAMNLKGAFDAVFVFIEPPSLEELKRRLEGRKTESLEVIQKRLDWAKRELEMSRFYDYCIVNDDLDHAYESLRKIVISEVEQKK